MSVDELPVLCAWLLSSIIPSAEIQIPDVCLYVRSITNESQ
jgi:hypothetical protein